MNGLYDEVRIALHGIWQRRWIALGVAWALCLLGWLVVGTIPNAYESTARVFVQMGTLLPDKMGVSQADQMRDVDRVRQTLASAVNLQKVVRGTDIGLTVASDRDMADRVEALRKAITITSTQDNLVQITARSASSGLSDAANAKLSRAIVQKLIDIFVEENLAGGRSETSQTLKFLDAQLAQRARQLQDAETKRVQFETQYMGSLPGTGSISDRLDAARAELSRIETELAAAQSSLAAVNGQMAATPATVPGASGGGGGAVAGPAHSRLATLQGQLADARAKGWTDQHPDVIALNNQIASARAAAAGERVGGGGGGGASVLNPLYVSLRSMQAEKAAAAAALGARKAQIQADLNAFVQRQTADPAFADQASRLQRDYSVLKDQYDKLLGDREEVKLRGQMETETDAVKFRVIDPPSSPRKPVAPNRPLLLTLVLIAGIGGGIAAAFALGQIRTTYPTVERLAQASGLPVVGSIGAVTTAAAEAEAKQRLKWFAGGAAALGGAWAVLLLIEFVQRGMVA